MNENKILEKFIEKNQLEDIRDYIENAYMIGFNYGVEIHKKREAIYKEALEELTTTLDVVKIYIIAKEAIKKADEVNCNNVHT